MSSRINYARGLIEEKQKIAMTVLIVGAGPTGLFLGIELLRRGIPCRIIEKNAEPSERSRALAIQSRTLEVFDHLGIVEAFLEKGKKI